MVKWFSGKFKSNSKGPSMQDKRIKKPYAKAYVEITNICNRACSFCHGTKRAPKEMTHSEFSRIIDEISPLTDYVYLHVMGEPLTHPGLVQFIKTVNERGLKCAITTNSTLLSERQNELIQGGVYKVNVSVHSFEDGPDGEYIEYLSDIVDFADKASKSGVLVVLRLWNKGCDDGRNDKTLAFFKERLFGEWKCGARGVRIRHKLHLEYGDRFEWPDIEAKEGDGRVFCYGLSDHFGVLSDGSVIPCCLDSDGVITLGNAYTESVKEILSSERAEAIRHGFKNRCVSEQLCRRCGYARRF